MESAKVLEQVLESRYIVSANKITVEAEPQWFPREGCEDGTEGEAQAVILVEGKRYALTLEALP
jgi:hypothetical protein